MPSQWDCFLKNLGQWRGSFAYLSPAGAIEKEIPSVVTLTGEDDDRAIRLTVEYPTESHRNVLWRFHAPETGMTLFDNGAFSRANDGESPYLKLAVEQGLISGGRRLRLVQIFNVGSPARVTLIQEGLPGCEDARRSPLTAEQLLGTWQGEAVEIDPTGNQRVYSTCLTVAREGERLHQTLQFGDREISSVARIDGSILHFEDKQPHTCVLLLSDGGSARAPIQIQQGVPFQMELGWLLEPTVRQRLVRSYDESGRWLHATLVTEHKTA
ncbi:MAG: DUF3598 family protein [Cyanobacteria bacterium P01_F01_bin.33]